MVPMLTISAAALPWSELACDASTAPVMVPALASEGLAGAEVDGGAGGGRDGAQVEDVVGAGAAVDQAGDDRRVLDVRAGQEPLGHRVVAVGGLVPHLAGQGVDQGGVLAGGGATGADEQQVIPGTQRQRPGHGAEDGGHVPVVAQVGVPREGGAIGDGEVVAAGAHVQAAAGQHRPEVDEGIVPPTQGRRAAQAVLGGRRAVLGQGGGEGGVGRPLLGGGQVLERRQGRAVDDDVAVGAARHRARRGPEVEDRPAPGFPRGLVGPAVQLDGLVGAVAGTGVLVVAAVTGRPGGHGQGPQDGGGRCRAKRGGLHAHAYSPWKKRGLP